VVYLFVKRKKRKIRKPLSESVRAGTIALTFVSVALLCFASLAYLYHKNSTATMAYKLKDLEREHKKLLYESENQSAKLAKMKSLKKVMDDSFVSKMPLAKNPMYIRVDTAVARK